MKAIQYLLIFALLILFCCSEGNDVTDNPGPAVGSPVETNSPNTNYTPAYAGQTRIGGVQTSTEIEATVVTSALSAPWGIISLPDGRLLITQKGGQLRIVTTAGAVGSTITGLP